VAVTTERKGVIYVNSEKNETNIGMKDQLAYWQENKIILNCFPSKNMKQISSYQEFQTKRWTKADPRRNVFFLGK